MEHVHDKHHELVFVFRIFKKKSLFDGIEYSYVIYHMVQFLLSLVNNTFLHGLFCINSKIIIK